MQDESSVIFSLPGAPPLQENYAEAPCLDYFSNIPDQVVVLFILPQIHQSPTMNSVSEMCNATKQLVKLRAVCKIFSNLLTNENIRQILTNSGFDLSEIINKNDGSCNSTLYWAITSKYYSAQIPALIILGADPNVNTNNGQKPLHIAIRINNTRAINLLLDYGANPNSKIEGSDDNLRDKTAIQQAYYYHNQKNSLPDLDRTEAIGLLLNHGAIIDATYLANVMQIQPNEAVVIERVSHKHKKACCIS